MLHLNVQYFRESRPENPRVALSMSITLQGMASVDSLGVNNLQLDGCGLICYICCILILTILVLIRELGLSP